MLEPADLAPNPISVAHFQRTCPGAAARPEPATAPAAHRAKPFKALRSDEPDRGIMRVIFDHARPSGRIMPVMQVIEAQSARSWGLTISSITNTTGRLGTC